MLNGTGLLSLLGLYMGFGVRGAAFSLLASPPFIAALLSPATLFAALDAGLTLPLPEASPPGVLRGVRVAVGLLAAPPLAGEGRAAVGAAFFFSFSSLRLIPRSFASCPLLRPCAALVAVRGAGSAFLTPLDGRPFLGAGASMALVSELARFSCERAFLFVSFLGPGAGSALTLGLFGAGNALRALVGKSFVGNGFVWNTGLLPLGAAEAAVAVVTPLPYERIQFP